MLSPEENKLLCEVGPGTPAGELHRRYWQPIAATADLIENPVRKIKILGEELVVYKTRMGKYGLTQSQCPHRRMGLEFGIPEEDGLRCSYHGWLFDRTGQCREMPLEPATSKLASKVCAKVYPVEELGGLIFGYLGPAPVPALPRWDVLMWPNSIRQIGRYLVNCNWLQSAENSFDVRHNEYLHGHYFKYWLERRGKKVGGRPELEMKHPYTELEVEESTYGFLNIAERAGIFGSDEKLRNIHNYYVFPYFSRQGGKRIRAGLNYRVPIDDTKHWYLTYEAFTAPEGFEVAPQDVVPVFEPPLKNEKGEWLMEDTVVQQDAAAWESQGEITDRSKEKLASSDHAVVAFRRLLKKQIEIVRNGGTPMNVFPDAHECLHLEPRLGGFDRELLTEAKMGYDKFTAAKNGPMITQIINLVKAVAESGKVEELALGVGK
jgi:5,5'-dehydrodivanillate O-demethylase